MIGFAGLSHLGITYSLATAAQGFDVVAFHPSADLVADLADGRFPIAEPGLNERLATNRARIRYTADPADLEPCELVFVSLDVRTDDHNRSNTAPLEDLIRLAAPRLGEGSTLVLLSQVNPGFTRRLRMELQRSGAFPSGEIYYQVETLIFGRALERALSPERFMVGAADPAAPLPAPLRRWHESFECPVLVMRYESAELAKIAVNLFLVSSVSTTNTLAEVCERIGADWREIAPALRLDARIGPKAYLSPGLGISGGNLERDLATVKRLLAGTDADTSVVDAWIENSRHRKAWPGRTLREAFARRGIEPVQATVAVWGLAYKEDTDSTKNSPSLAFLATIPEIPKRVYDPAVKLAPDALPAFTQLPDPLPCCQGADALLILTPWPEFRSADLRAIRAAMRGRVILDPFGLLDGAATAELGFDHYLLGLPARRS